MKITNGALAQLITNLLTNPQSGELDSMGAFSNFCTDLAEVVCQYCGGDVVVPAQASNEYGRENSDFESTYSLEIESGTEEMGGGQIWKTTTAIQGMAGYMACEGAPAIQVTFEVPIGASRMQKDAAFLEALAMQVQIDYLNIGERSAHAEDHPGDFGLTLNELQDKYGREHPDHTVNDWREAVANHDTKLGYWDWVRHSVESLYYDNCDLCPKNGCNKTFAPGHGFVCHECASTAEMPDLHFSGEVPVPKSTRIVDKFKNAAKMFGSFAAVFAFFFIFVVYGGYYLKYPAEFLPDLHSTMVMVQSYLR